MAAGIVEIRQRAVEIILATAPDFVPSRRFTYVPSHDELLESSGRADVTRGFHVRARPPLEPRTQGICTVIAQQLLVEVRYEASFRGVDPHRLISLEDAAYSDQARIQAALLAPANTTFGLPASPKTTHFDSIAFIQATELEQSLKRDSLYVAGMLFEVEYRLGNS